MLYEVITPVGGRSQGYIDLGLDGVTTSDFGAAALAGAAAPPTIEELEARVADAPDDPDAHRALGEAVITSYSIHYTKLYDVNGTQAQAGLAALLVHDAMTLWRTAHAAAAMTLEAVRGSPDPFDARIHDA